MGVQLSRRRLAKCFPRVKIQVLQRSVVIGATSAVADYHLNKFKVIFKDNQKQEFVINLKKSSDSGGSGGNGNGNGNNNENMFYYNLFNYAFTAYVIYNLFSVASKPRVKYHVARFDHVDVIIEVTNDAFLADAFFKKKEYHKRFNRTEVMDMLNTENAIFLLAVLPNSVLAKSIPSSTKKPTKSSSGSSSGIDAKNGDDTESYGSDFHYSDFTPDDGSAEFRPAEHTGPTNVSFDEKNFVCGSLYLSWHTDLDVEGALRLTGKVSAVSVPTRWAKKGIGKKMIKQAEDHLLKVAKELGTYGQQCSAVVMEMGVINVRQDLFSWYEKQGYTKGDPLPHDRELDRIISHDMKDKVFCVRMSKVLQTAAAAAGKGE